MSIGKITNCSNCHNRHIKAEAVSWCPYCDEAFCIGCEDHHSAARLTKGHKIISVAEYNNLPLFFENIENYCDIHDEKFELFCSFHRQCCCPTCVRESHHECLGIETIQSVIENVKTSSSLYHLEISLNNIRDTVESIKENGLENKARIEMQKELFIASVRNTRAKIIQHLDSLERKIVEQISSEVNDIHSKIDNLTKNLDEKQKKVMQFQESVASIKTLPSDLLAFFGMLYIEKKTEEETGHLLSLRRNHKLDELALNFQISEDILSFCNSTECFGDIFIETKPSSVGFENLLGMKQAQITPVEDFDPSEIKIEWKRIIPFPDFQTDVTGCTVSDDGCLVFVDIVNNCLMLYNNYGKFIKQVISFTNYPIDVTYLEKNKVAVSIKDEKRVAEVDLSNGVECSSLDFIDECWGIEFVNGKLIVKSKELIVISKSGKYQFKVQGITHVSADKERIFCSHSELNAVFCYTSDGELLWEFKNEILLGPRDITTDEKGCVYVAGEESDNVIVISNDGRLFAEILNKDNGLKSPVGIHFDRTSQNLLVTNNGLFLALLCHITEE